MVREGGGGGTLLGPRSLFPPTSVAPLLTRSPCPVVTAGKQADPATVVPSKRTEERVGLFELGSQPLAPPRPLSSAKAHELTYTNVLCGEEKPPAQPPAPTVVSSAAATAKSVSRLSVAELRVELRSRGLSPAGGKETLEERLLAGLALGSTQLLLPTKAYPSGLQSSTLAAAYARADGNLNLGEAAPHAPRKDAQSGGMAAVLGGERGASPPPAHPPCAASRAQLASHILNAPMEADARPAAGVRMSERRARDSAGSALFTPAPAPSGPAWSVLKAADYKGSGLFEEGHQPERLSGATRLGLAAKRQDVTSMLVAQGGMAGYADDKPPALSLSLAKSAEFSGSHIFAPPGNEPPPPLHTLRACSDAKLAEMHGSMSFEEPPVQPRRRSGGMEHEFDPHPTSPPSPEEVGRQRDHASSCLP